LRQRRLFEKGWTLGWRLGVDLIDIVGEHIE
jgi:hypothetical protein